MPLCMAAGGLFVGLVWAPAPVDCDAVISHLRGSSILGDTR
jgi:hypothetical protein